jgi:hypothetical protein
MVGFARNEIEERFFIQQAGNQMPKYVIACPQCKRTFTLGFRQAWLDRSKL